MNGLMEMMKLRSTGINHMLKLAQAGFTVECQQTFKNNGILNGFCLRSDNREVSPMVYMSEELMSKSDAEMAEYLMAVFKNSDVRIPDLSRVITKEYILDHVMPRLFSDENAKDMDDNGISYMRLPDVPLLVGFYMVVSEMNDGTATVGIMNRHLNMTGLDVSDLWSAAVTNLEPECAVVNMTSILGEMVGEMAPIIPDVQPMWVVTNRTKLYGAAAILCPKTADMLTERLGERFIILPSSVHELICIPGDDKDPGSLVDMVKEINESMVSLQDRLSNDVFVYEDGLIRLLK